MCEEAEGAAPCDAVFTCSSEFHESRFDLERRRLEYSTRRREIRWVCLRSAIHRHTAGQVEH